MRASDIAAIMDKATKALGGSSEGFSLVLLNEASAYPHGSEKPQAIREGSVILMDCGCTVHEYQSDISRTWVFGTPTAKQLKVWNTVKRGQEIALETAKPGIEVGKIDDAVRITTRARAGVRATSCRGSPTARVTASGWTGTRILPRSRRRHAARGGHVLFG